jgi:hypothetical protein
LTLPVVPLDVARLNTELRIVMKRESSSLTQPTTLVTVRPSISTCSRPTIRIPGVERFDIVGVSDP